jgi:ribA/ribD-fused uncharacterized protein
MSARTKNDLTRRDGFVLFWSGWPSNWFYSPFVIDGIPYTCGEQWMMAEKARQFGDDQALHAILSTSSPREQKALGRDVRNYDDDVWMAVARDRLYVGLLEKFRQNPDLCRRLLDTGTDVIVEASPLDRRWGIGLAKDHPDATHPSRWRGGNWLGEVLMRVRETLRAERDVPTTV